MREPIERQQALPRYFVGEVKSLLAYTGDSALAAALGINLADLDGPEATIPLPVYHDLMERAAAVTGDPHFGLHFALHWHQVGREGGGAIASLMLSSPSLRVMCDRLIRYQRYWNAGDAYEVAEAHNQFSLGHRFRGPWREAHIQMAEKTAAGIVAMVRSVEPTCQPLAVRFPHRLHGDQSELAAALGVAPTFGAAWTEIVLPAAVMDKPLATANAGLFRLCDRYLTMRLREVREPEPDYTARVRAALQQALSEGDCSQQMVARLLGCHSRTLQRRLAEEATTLRKVVDEVRKARASEVLESKMAIAEVSFALGYSEPAAFQHAFRRWWGMSPQAWRNARKSRTADPAMAVLKIVQPRALIRVATA